MDMIGVIAELVAALIPGGVEYDPVRTIVSFLVYASILFGVAFARPIALTVPAIRSKVEPQERYAGHYVQIIENDEHRRCSLLKVFYDAKARTYLLSGIQYGVAGAREIDFTSHNVAFRAGPMTYMEYVWQAESIRNKERFDGYTMMRFDDTSNLEMLEGRGFYVTFHHTPQRSNLRFFKLSEERLKYLNINEPTVHLVIPKSESERAQFVRDLHFVLQSDCSLQPTEEASELLT